MERIRSLPTPVLAALVAVIVLIAGVVAYRSLVPTAVAGASVPLPDNDADRQAAGTGETDAADDTESPGAGVSSSEGISGN